MKTQSKKAKGRSLQKFTAALVSDIFDLEEGDVESRPMGSGGVDLMMSPLARRRCPVSFECKSTRKPPSVSELKQSQANAYKGTLPVVCWKPFGKQYKDTMVMANLEEFLKFIDELQGEGR